ncbi:MAG TPA: hypothetical protein PKZ32_02135 [Candidatus Melainabacteria bacterium]|nr:hypothetical protein [Candidatus Melainabacteria bacterium]
MRKLTLKRSFSSRLGWQMLSLALSSGIILSPPAMSAHKPWPGSPLTEETQIELERASRYMKNNPAKAMPAIMNALNSATDIPKCMAIAAYTERYGHPMLEARRACITKALTYCQTREDFLHLALKARQYECFEVTRAAVNNLIGNSDSVDELLDLAHKAHEVALNDVCHLAMEKAYNKADSVEEALKFAREAKVMGMEDLSRKATKELIDDEPDPHELCLLLRSIEPLDHKDLNRYLLKKAIDECRTVLNYRDVYDCARRTGHQDIMKLAEFRGKKMQILEKYNASRAEYQQKVDAARAQQGQQQQQQSQGLPTGF